MDLSSAFTAMHISSKNTRSAKPQRCLADQGNGFRCIRDGTFDKTTIDTAKNEQDRVMDCLCKTHKFYLERQVRTY